MEFYQCHAKGHFFYHIIKDNERNICQIFLAIENTDSALKVQALHYANELLVRLTLFFQKLFANSLNLQKQYEKYVWENKYVGESVQLQIPRFMLRALERNPNWDKL